MKARLQGHLERSIHDIRSWPVGEFIAYNTHKEWKRQGSPSDIVPFDSLGMVISNDGVDRIAVIWGSSCRHSYMVYQVGSLNSIVIYHVGE